MAPPQPELPLLYFSAEYELLTLTLSLSLTLTLTLTPSLTLTLTLTLTRYELLLGGGEAEGGEGMHVFYGPAGETLPPG